MQARHGLPPASVGCPSFESEVGVEDSGRPSGTHRRGLAAGDRCVRKECSRFDFFVRRRYNVSALAGAPGLTELGGGASGKPTRMIERVST
jgi:hypothetical protein